MGRIAPRKNTSLCFSLPGLDGLREKWSRCFGPDDDFRQTAVESDDRALTGESVKRTPGQNTRAQDGLPAALTEDAPYALAIGSAGHRPNYLTDVPPRMSAAPAPPSAGASLRGQALLVTLWHLPDGFNWMGLLPFMHRRWLLIIALLLAIALLWPYSPTTTPAPVALQ